MFHTYPVLSFRASARAYQTLLSPFLLCSACDGRCIVSGIIYVIKHGLQWKDAPDAYGPHKTLYNRFIKWSRLVVFNKFFTNLANQTFFDGSLMIDSTRLKAYRIGRTEGGLNSKLHAVCDGFGRLILLLLTERQVSDYKGRPFSALVLR